jgi:uncharacterized membrane protein YgcG
MTTRHNICRDSCRCQTENCSLACHRGSRRDNTTAGKTDNDAYTLAVSPTPSPADSEMAAEESSSTSSSRSTLNEDSQHDPPITQPIIRRSHSLPTLHYRSAPPSYDSALGHLEVRELRVRAQSVSRGFSYATHERFRDSSSPIIPYSYSYYNDKSLSVLVEGSRESGSSYLGGGGGGGSSSGGSRSWVE